MRPAAGDNARMMEEADTPEADRQTCESRWLSLTTDRILLGLLAVEAFILSSATFRWFGFHEDLAWTAWLAVGTAAVAGILFLIRPHLRGRRWYQFSLRSLLIFTLICALASAWLARRMEQKRSERAAAQTIIELGGQVIYDYQMSDGIVVSGARPPGPTWIRTLLGDNVFNAVVDVNLVRVGDARRIDLKAFSQLQTLYLIDTGFTDALLENIEGMTRLQRLYLNGSSATDVGLAHLKGLAQLQTLYLDGINITDAGLKNLEGLTQLRNLGLQDTRISDVGLANLRGLSRLQYLDLTRTRVTDDGVRALQQARPNCFISVRKTALRQWGSKIW
jgi:hypothetical protein